MKNHEEEAKKGRIIEELTTRKLGFKIEIPVPEVVVVSTESGDMNQGADWLYSYQKRM